MAALDTPSIQRVVACVNPIACLGHDTLRLLAAVDARIAAALEGALATMNDQTRQVRAVAAASDANTREARAMARGVMEAIAEFRALAGGGQASEAAPSPAADDEAPETGQDDTSAANAADENADPPPAGDGADQRQPEARADSDQASGDDEDPGRDDASSARTRDRREGEVSATDGQTPSETSDGAADGGDEDSTATATADNTAAGAALVDEGVSKSDDEILRVLTRLETRLADEAPAAGNTMTAALDAIRSEWAALRQTLAAVPPAWEAVQEVMARLDDLARIIRPVALEPEKTLPLPLEIAAPPEPAPPALPPPGPPPAADDLGEAVGTLLAAAARPQRAFSRFALAALVAVLLTAVPLGAFLQQQHALLGTWDATGGWKDRVWQHAGEEIARCIAASTPHGGTCAVTLEPATPP